MNESLGFLTTSSVFPVCASLSIDASSAHSTTPALVEAIDSSALCPDLLQKVIARSSCASPIDAACATVRSVGPTTLTRSSPTTSSTFLRLAVFKIRQSPVVLFAHAAYRFFPRQTTRTQTDTDVVTGARLSPRCSKRPAHVLGSSDTILVHTTLLSLAGPGHARNYLGGFDESSMLRRTQHKSMFTIWSLPHFAEP
jgi:hypothetical protein